MNTRGIVSDNKTRTALKTCCQEAKERGEQSVVVLLHPTPWVTSHSRQRSCPTFRQLETWNTEVSACVDSSSDLTSEQLQEPKVKTQQVTEHLVQHLRVRSSHACTSSSKPAVDYRWQPVSHIKKSALCWWCSAWLASSFIISPRL